MWNTSNVVLTALSAVLGLLGIVIAGKAVDLGMEIFGGLMIAFSAITIIGGIRRAYPHR